MSSVDFEYAIKKDVRNNPIVREVDQARQRQLWRSLAIGACSCSSCSSRPGRNSSCCSTGTGFRTCRRNTPREVEINRRLRLEVETLRAPERIADDREEAEPRRPTARPGHRDRAGDALGAPRQVRRRRALNGTGALVTREQLTGRLRLPSMSAQRVAARELPPHHSNGARRCAPECWCAPRCLPFGRWASKRGSSTCRSSQHAEMTLRANKQQLRTFKLAGEARRDPGPQRPAARLQCRCRNDRRRPAARRRPRQDRAPICDAIDALRRREAARARGEVEAQEKPICSYLERQVSPDAARRVKGSNLPGIVLYKESRRYYPNRTLAGHVLGFVGHR